MLNPQSIQSISLRMVNGDIENFFDISIEGVVKSLNTDGTWNTTRLLLDNDKGWTERIIYTQHIVNLNYKENYLI